MGCDIHAYLEHKEFGGSWWAFSYGKICLFRNYEAFSLMAGVRSSYGKEVLFNPKGLPDDVCWTVSYEDSLFVSNEEGDGRCSKEEAASWVDQGWSEFREDGRVSHPDWHSHSWLSKDEFDAVLKKLGQRADVGYQSILVLMEFLESKGHETRLVFWFDN